MALFAKKVPEDGRKGFVVVIVEIDFLGALLEEVFRDARCRNAGQIPLHVRAEDWNAMLGKALSEDLQRDGLACSSRSGDQSMPVGKFQTEFLTLDALADKDGLFVAHGISLQ